MVSSRDCTALTWTENYTRGLSGPLHSLVSKSQTGIRFFTFPRQEAAVGCLHHAQELRDVGRRREACGTAGPHCQNTLHKSTARGEWLETPAGQSTMKAQAAQQRLPLGEIRQIPWVPEARNYGGY